MQAVINGAEDLTGPLETIELHTTVSALPQAAMAPPGTVCLSDIENAGRSQDLTWPTWTYNRDQSLRWSTAELQPGSINDMLQST